MKKVPVGILVLVLCLGLISAVQAAGPASTWTKHASNPVINRIGDGWDNAKVYAPSLLALAGNPYSYVAFYTGSDGSTERIGIATSSDAVNWTRYGSNPVLTPGDPNLGEWDGYAVAVPSVVYDGNLFRMWYTGSDGTTLRLGLAESVDGTTWNKVGGGLVMDIGGADTFESASVGMASIIYQDGVFKMWYSGHNGWQWAIGFATSPDGVNWTKYGSNPVFSKGGAGTFDENGVWLPSVIYKDGQYQMFYTGVDNNNQFRIGYATSTDAVNWSRSSSPIINVGSGGSFDEKNAWTPSVVYSNNAYLMLYTGVNSGDSNTIGLALNIPPKISGPVVAGEVTVRGWGTPGSTVSIISYPAGTTIGSGTVPSTGQFAIAVTPLVAGTGLEAAIGSDHSERQTVFATLVTEYLPVIMHIHNQD